jgi:hypothetical protein
VSLSPPLRRVALTAHVAASVGWLGAVAAFLALALPALATERATEVRAAYIAMDVVARLAILPLCLAALTTGVVQGLGTPWGLFRHWWVSIKLAITVVSTALLLLHMQPIAEMARLAAASAAPLEADAHRALRVQLVADAGAALAALLVTTTLSVVKPVGLTRWGRRAVRTP